MSTLETTLRRGLQEAAANVRAGEALDSVLKRGRRKKAVRKAAATTGVACVALLVGLGLPRLSLGDRNMIAPAGQVSSSVLGLALVVDPPSGWELDHEAAGLVRFSGPEDAEVVLLEPSAVEDPRRTFGATSPGPTVLAGWIAAREELAESEVQQAEVGGAASIAISGMYTAEGTPLLELVTGEAVAPPLGDHVELHALNEAPILVVAWDDDGGRDIERLLSALRLQS